ncbi:MAG: ATP-dependent DNA helicase RecG [Erysipelotrichaceae bacterium]|nr:ATP-dependent DNA helicase RecG [Erysipelotrichaceae bacterium]
MLTLKQCGCTTRQIEMMQRLNCETPMEVLSLYPFRYECLEAVPFSEWKIHDKVCFEGALVNLARPVRLKGGRTMTRFLVETEEEIFEVTIFNRPWVSNIQVGNRITVIGRYDGACKVTAIQYNTKPLQQQLGITPVYPMKEGMRQSSIYNVIKKVFMAAFSQVEEGIPQDLKERYRLLDKKTALRCIHFPRTMNDVTQAIRTLKYEEFLHFHLALLMRKQTGYQATGTGKKFNRQRIEQCMNNLPFECTPDQKTTILEILDDLQKDKNMVRLVQGDVGCGKTVVAAMSMLASVDAHKQAALMAPTEILAKQHYQSLQSLLKDEHVRIACLVSAMSEKEKRQILEDLKSGAINMIVGTHALIQKNVEFHDLGLVIADEQHRFGVNQRKALKEKGTKVDFLLMSATPIPRTLANTLYGDMDVSTIHTLPSGRKPVMTQLVKKNSLSLILDELMEALAANQQIYVICAAIEENEAYDARNVLDIADALSKVFFGVGRVGVLHGKMSAEEKEEVMNQFQNNQIQILVSTTVVEVGVNVINATVMVIYDAHRFGLSQLHQLRGRVQRGSVQGKCYLLTDSKDSDALKRLDVLVKCSDGFEISRQDLMLRGPGDLLGTRQSGLPVLHLGNLFEDEKMIVCAKLDAQNILKQPENIEYRTLIERLQYTYQSELD